MKQALSPEQWQSVNSHLAAALELDPPEQEALLASVMQTDPEVAAVLRSMLARRSQAGYSSFLEGSVSSPVAVAADATMIGRQVGAYVIDAEIGRGGMGSVWRAHRTDGRYEGTVAVKFVHAAWIGGVGEQRFRIEGLLLAQLDHPNIARLIDAGVLEGSQPYLVLEYVQGEPIDRYCDQNHLGIEERVKLFLGVLAAVAHAHSHFIVHRDIKPANILVTADGVVKLLDFGIAKLLEEGSGGAGLTKSQASALTPQFAAPEQLLGKPVTTATDVYALGLVLYLLLTGKQAIEADSGSSAALIHAVLTADPPRPSAAAGQGSSWRRSLLGDLDNIVAKALKKAPGERYPTAESLAADLRGYLNHEPVSARRDSFGYVTGKFVRKHRWQVAAAAMTFLILITGVVATGLQAREAQRQRAAAVAQRDRARALLARNDAIFSFVEMMLTSGVPPDQVASTKQMLDRGTKFVDIIAGGQVDRQAEILHVLATYYVELSDPANAAPLLQRAAKLLEAAHDPSRQAEMECAYADVLGFQARAEEAQKITENWGLNPAIDGNAAGDCLHIRARLAQSGNDPAAALRFAELGLKRVKSAADPAGKMQVVLTDDEGFALYLNGRNAEAVERFRSALDQLDRMGLPESQEAKTVMMNWGVVAMGSGDSGRALEIYERLFRSEQRIAGSEPVWPAIIANYAHALEIMGRYDDAIHAYDQTFDSSVKNNWVAGQGYALVGRASGLFEEEQVDEAQSVLDRAAKILKGKVAEASSPLVRLAFLQARIDLAKGRVDSANRTLARLVEVVASGGDKPNGALVSVYRLQAELASRAGDRAGAGQLAAKAIDMAKRLAAGNRYSAISGQAQLTLGSVMTAQGNSGAARAALTAAIEDLDHTVGRDHPDTRKARTLLAAL